ncbi:MAG: ANTAR domain-containing protein [Lachnospiraceae bacterium]|nr:ANTAR domain-containing protein [Lachnospiraceae bacterium]
MLVNIIVVFPKKEVAGKIKNILVKNGYEVAAVCVTGAQAIQVVERLEAGIIVSGIRFVDMVYYELKECLPDTFEMLVIASNDHWQQYGGDDVIFLPLPMKAYDLVDTVEDMYRDLSNRLKRLRSKPKQRSADQQGVINQAKELLMEHRGYSEEEAHRFLQKHSMDTGNNMVDTAYMVLEMF